MAQSLTDRYDERIAGVLSCYDRVVITGSMPSICYSQGMTAFLYTRGIRIFDYPQFAATLRDRVREAAASVAAAAPTLPRDSGKRQSQIDEDRIIMALQNFGTRQVADFCRSRMKTHSKMFEFSRIESKMG